MAVETPLERTKEGQKSSRGFATEGWKTIACQECGQALF